MLTLKNTGSVRVVVTKKTYVLMTTTTPPPMLRLLPPTVTHIETVFMTVIILVTVQYSPITMGMHPVTLLAMAVSVAALVEQLFVEPRVTMVAALYSNTSASTRIPPVENTSPTRSPAPRNTTTHPRASTVASLNCHGGILPSYFALTRDS